MKKIRRWMFDFRETYYIAKERSKLFLKYGKIYQIPLRYYVNIFLAKPINSIYLQVLFAFHIFY